MADDKNRWNNRELSFLNTHDRLDAFYRNARNNIEDPIFTGFTLSIDNLHSPLFNSCCESIWETETLRSSPMDASSKETGGLSQKLEDSIKNMYKVHIYGNPDTYEITTVGTKDNIGDRQTGYGLQEKFYLDNPIYGAVDYIYMVDKVSLSKYTDFLGVSDMGNGGTGRNAYQSQQEIAAPIVGEGLVELMNAKMEEQINKMTFNEDTGTVIIPDASEPTQEEYEASINAAFDNAIEKKEQEMSAKEAEHTRNRTAKENAKNEYDNKKNELKALENELQELESAYKKQSDELENEFNGLKSNIDKCYRILNSSTSTDSNKSDAENEVNRLFIQYENLINYFNNSNSSDDYSQKYKYLNVKFNIPTEKDIKNELNKLKPAEEEEEEKKNEVIFDTSSVYYKIFQITKTSIKTNTLNDTLEKDINKKKEDIEKKKKEVYGVHSDGRIGSAGDPGMLENGNPSPCLVFTEAQKKFETDAYSKMSYELSELKDTKENIEYISGYIASQNNKKQVTQNIPDIDYTREENESDDAYSNRIKEAKNSREMFEVPQTVYDMIGFVNGMKDLTTRYPYYLQSITGLDEAYKNYFEIKDPYMGSGDNKITITCLESLDLRITSMFNKYFNAVYDRQYRRERVPVNLRRFQCSIFVHDIRNFKDTILGGDYIGDLSSFVEIALNYVSAIEFKFYDCEIVPEETGSIFDSVTNIPSGDMRSTNFTFKYGNCVINFLPFEDLRRYFLTDINTITNTAPILTEELDKDDIELGVEKEKVLSSNSPIPSQNRDGNFRRWFDKSELGNVNNNDYRDYIRHDSSVAVDEYYKTTIVNNFALNSVVNKNKELTAMDDALRRIVVGISASTGIPTEGVADTLNVRNIIPYLTEQDKAVAVVKDLGTVIGEEKPGPEIVKDLGNVNIEKGGN